MHDWCVTQVAVWQDTTLQTFYEAEIMKCSSEKECSEGQSKANVCALSSKSGTCVRCVSCFSGSCMVCRCGHRRYFWPSCGLGIERSSFYLPTSRLVQYAQIYLLILSFYCRVCRETSACELYQTIERGSVRVVPPLPSIEPFLLISQVVNSYQVASKWCCLCRNP